MALAGIEWKRERERAEKMAREISGIRFVGITREWPTWPRISTRRVRPRRQGVNAYRVARGGVDTTVIRFLSIRGRP